jgi:pSer/pThr/pTyr-binding forkhead associated (FHA) protein
MLGSLAVAVRFMLRIDDRILMLEDEVEMVVGRASDCGICLDDLLVSRRHAVFRARPDGAYVEDLGSRNGITINGLAQPGETKVRHGDRIGVGSHVIQVLDANREKHQTLPRVPAGRADETVPTMPVSPHANATTQAGRDVFGMLFDVADKAIGAGRIPDAHSAVEYLSNGLIEALEKGKPVTEPTLDRAASYLLQMAELTKDGRWIDRLLEIYDKAERVPSGTAIETMTALIPRVRAASGVALRGFVQRMLHRPLPPADRLRLKRLELLGS